MPATAVGPIEPVFTVRRAVLLDVRAGKDAAGGDAYVGISTVVDVDVEHRMYAGVEALFSGAEAKGKKTKSGEAFIVVGRQHNAYRVSVAHQELIHSPAYAELDDEVRAKVIASVRKIVQYHADWQAANSTGGIPETPTATDEVPDPARVMRSIKSRETKLSTQLAEVDVLGEFESDPVSGVYGLLDLLEELDIAVVSQNELVDVLTELPITDMVSSGNAPINIPSIDAMRAASAPRDEEDDEEEAA